MDIDREMFEEIKKGTVHHRRCDVCGCELAVPDIGVFSRSALNSMACTVCTDTKAHLVLLSYITDLRKNHLKEEILKILDERMVETWGDEVSVFTVDDVIEAWKIAC